MKQFVLIIALACTLCACGQSDRTGAREPSALPTLDAPGDLNAIKSRGELVIVTRNAPTVAYIDRDGRSSGPEHDLAVAFAHYLDVTPRFVQVSSVGAMLEAVATDKADMAAGSITKTAARATRFTFGPPYMHVTEQVVCNNNSKPRRFAQLATRVNSLVVAADTSYDKTLKRLAAQQPSVNVSWRTAKDVGTEVLLQRVARGKIDCTVADSNIVAINRRYYPKLLVMFNLGKPEPLAWPMPKGSTKLQKAATRWLAAIRKKGGLAVIHEQYYGYLDKWNYVDKNALVRRIKSVYPRYAQDFADAAQKYDFEQWLLAAQAYQESHWDPQARSHTGVRGMMMLTEPTAQSLGVTDRLDARQSIMGGARYLRKMEKKLPDDLAAPDRYYFALAAYNIGYYHLRDAMTLARRAGLNPLRWSVLRKMLPRLMQRRYYRTVPYGYANGIEAVRYVRHIRDYSDIIHQIAGTE